MDMASENYSDISLTPFQAQIAERLKASTLTPGFVQPTEAMHNSGHRIVQVGTTPVMALGPESCPYSARQADALVQSERLADALKVLGLEGELTSTTRNGKDIQWPDACAALIVKPSGTIVDGRPLSNPVQGALNSLITLPTETGQKLASALCTDNDLLHILDPWAPALPTT